MYVYMLADRVICIYVIKYDLLITLCKFHFLHIYVC